MILLKNKIIIKAFQIPILCELGYRKNDKKIFFEKK